ncbi:MAG: UDP-4-amino-4,6-dideoxy-N-acetyl-beta-L-altrosamine transaminase [Aestuariivita sp.]|nr:UDP-4-amino-4,6-dideoxy-N-acetyl-beta-L-altrosamine transaminase [Aestuariivita sp.]
MNIPYGRQEITQDDIDAVVNVLKSDFLTQGPMVSKFEASVAKFVNAKHAVAMNSATSALHLGCLALGLGQGDILWTSPITFVASANCARLCGANVDFVDINPLTFSLCPDKLADKFRSAEIHGKLPKIIVPVHLCGQSCDMSVIGALAANFGVKVLEDASHALGGAFEGRPVGNCTYSDVTVFSFHPVKIATTAEGGVAVSQNSKLAERMTILRNHGITRNTSQMTNQPDGPWYYQQLDLGFNYRMTDIQAALGISQMTRVTQYVKKRNRIAKKYDAEFADLPITTQYVKKNTFSAFHLYVVKVDPDHHLRVFKELRNAGINVNVHYIPVHLQPYYSNFGFSRGDFPIAEEYYSRAISLPIYPAMTERQQAQVIAAFRKAVLQ